MIHFPTQNGSVITKYKGTIIPLGDSKTKLFLLYWRVI